MAALPQPLMQGVYLGLTLLHFSIMVACYVAIFNNRVEPTRGGVLFTHLFAIANFFQAIAFMGSLMVTGAHPIRPRDVVLPYIQISWAIDFLMLIIPVALGTYRGFYEMFNPVAKPGPVGDEQDQGGN